MEARLARDFGDVRIHTGAEAARAAAALGANAFTIGNDVVFGAGRFDASSPRGRRLLTHELVHVAQQGDSPALDAIEIGGRNDPAEREARAIADDVVEGRTPAPITARGAGLAKEDDPAGPTEEEPKQAPPKESEPVSCPAPSPPCGFEPEAPVTGERLSDEEVARRQAQVRRAVEAWRPAYPIASANMEHWIEASGSSMVMDPEPFQREDSGLVRELRAQHMPTVEEGIRRRMADPADPETLATPGVTRQLHFLRSVRANPRHTGTERDLSIALGTYAVMSYITVRATETGAEIVSWCVQICDRYNFNAGVPAIVPLPEDMPVESLPEGIQVFETPLGRFIRTEDDWFRAIEASGGAREYDISSRVFPVSGLNDSFTK